MKQLLIFFFLFLSLTTVPEGFVAGTQVKTKYGYCSIEYIRKSDKVYAYDFVNKKTRYCKVQEIYRSRVPYYIRLFFDTHVLDVAPDQKVYTPRLDKWVSAENIVKSKSIQEFCKKHLGLVHAAYVFESTDVYIFTLKKYHTFYVTHQNILVHNFDLSFASVIPSFAIAAPMVAEGAVGLAQTCNPWLIAGACVVAGGYCLYNWAFAKQKHKKEVKHIKRKLKMERQRLLEQERNNGVSSGGPSKDPKKNKKKKKNEKKSPREYTQEDYELLKDDEKFTDLSLEDRDWLIAEEQNLQQQEHYTIREAEELHFELFRGEVKFNCRNQKVFKRGHTYITRDVDRHRGGFWKMYKYNKEPRIGTFNINLKIMVGK